MSADAVPAVAEPAAPLATTFSAIRIEVADAIATVTLAQPGTRNLFTAAMAIELRAAFDHIDAEDGIRAVILTGDGDTFCAGADLSGSFFNPTRGEGTADGPPTPDADRGNILGVSRDPGGWVSLRIAACTKPVIVAFNGAAVGVGLTMSLPADVRIAGHHTKLAFPFTRRGIVPEAASSWFLPRLVGISKAAEWVLSGRTIPTEEALKAGLLSYLMPEDEVYSQARRIAEDMTATTSATSVALARRMLWSALSAPSPWHAHAQESFALSHVINGGDAVEGVTAFLQKRPAQFPMRVSADLPAEIPAWPQRPAGLI